MPILLGLIIMMTIYRPLGAAFFGLISAANQLVYSAFGLI